MDGIYVAFLLQWRVFSFRLPRSPESAPSWPVFTSQAGAGHFWPLFQTLIVVDGDQAMLQRHRAELGRSFHLLTVADASGALELFDRERVDSVLVENTLPDRDGISLLEEIRTVRPQTHRLLASAETYATGSLSAGPRLSLDPAYGISLDRLAGEAGLYLGVVGGGAAAVSQ